MKYVFSLLILTIIFLASTVVPVKCSLTTQPVCPDPWSDPLGYAACVAAEKLRELYAALREFFSDVYFKLEALLHGIGVGLKSKIEDFFNGIAGFIWDVGSRAANMVSDFFHVKRR